MGGATHVYANNNAIAAKSAKGKSPMAFPDVCLSPPTPPPTGVPVPYPNTCFAKAIKKGSRSVYIRDKEIALEDKSFFKTSVGNEPATPALKKGVVSGKIKGKGYFQMWSPNVKVEGRSVDRHMDPVTHNHSNPGNGMLTKYVDDAMPGIHCEKDKNRINKECSENGQGDEASDNWMEKHCGPLLMQPDPANIGEFNTKHNNGAHSIVTKVDQAELSNLAQLQSLTKEQKDTARRIMTETQTAHAKARPCLEALKCLLIPYSKTKTSYDSEKKPILKAIGCCPGQTGHHLLPDGMFRKPALRGKRPKGSRNNFPKEDCWDGYSEAAAPTICVEGGGSTGSHGLLHTQTGQALSDIRGEFRHMTYASARNKVAVIVAKKYHCDPKCIEAQLDHAYRPMHNTTNNSKCGKLEDAKLVPHAGISGDGAAALKHPLEYLDDYGQKKLGALRRRLPCSRRRNRLR